MRFLTHYASTNPPQYRRYFQNIQLISQKRAFIGGKLCVYGQFGIKMVKANFENSQKSSCDLVASRV
jgi:hypothetical protein